MSPNFTYTASHAHQAEQQRRAEARRVRISRKLRRR
jgi:hypothetical protein